MYFNKAIIIGNLTKDPETRALPSGQKVCSFSLATNRVWKDKEGNKQEASDFHNIVVFGKQADSCGQYLKKGQTAMVEGRIQTRSWDDPSGQKKYRTEIVADRVQFGPKTGGSTGGSYSGGAGKGASAEEKEPPTIKYPEEEINPDDIPF